jgi:hypothetical protein
LLLHCNTTQHNTTHALSHTLASINGIVVYVDGGGSGGQGKGGIDGSVAGTGASAQRDADDDGNEIYEYASSDLIYAMNWSRRPVWSIMAG